MPVRESEEREIMEDIDDNPLERPIPCKERRLRNSTWSVSGSARLISAVVDKRERSSSLGKGVFIKLSNVRKLEDGARMAIWRA